VSQSETFAILVRTILNTNNNT